MKTRRSKRISESPIKEEDENKTGLSPSKRQKIKNTREQAAKISQGSQSPKHNGNESSDSSSDEYLVPSHKLDLNSDFFKIQKNECLNDFSEIESSIFRGVNRLSDSEESYSDDLKVDLKTISNSKTDEENCGDESNSCKKDKDMDCLSKKQSSDLDKRVLSKTKRQKITDQKKEIVALHESDVNNMDISQLLALGERSSSKMVIDKENKVFKMDLPCPVKNESKQSVAKEKSSVGKKVKLAVKAKVVGSPHQKIKSKDSQLTKNTNKLRKADSKLDRKRKNISVNKDSDSEDDLSEWEEVQDNEPQVPQMPHVFPADGIQVTVEMPDVPRCKKRGLDIAAYMRKKINQVKRDIQVLMHKGHLLCWIAHGNYVNSVINSDVLMGISLSLMPSEHCYPDKRTDMKYLQQVTQWFSKSIKVEERDLKDTNSVSLIDDLQKEFEKKIAYSKRELVLMFICMMRSLGVNVRLVISLQPVPLKPSASELYSEKTKDELEESKKSLQKVKNESDKTKVSKGKAKKSIPVIKANDGNLRKRRDVMSKEDAVNIIKKHATDKVNSIGNNSRKKGKVTCTSGGDSNSLKPSEKPEVKATKKCAAEKLGGKTNRSKKEENVTCKLATNRKDPKTPEKITSKLRERKHKKKYLDDPESSDSNDSGLDKSISPIDNNNSKMTLQSTPLKTPSSSGKKKGNSGEGDDSDYSPELVRNKHSSATNDRRVLSTDSDEAIPVNLKKKDRCDVWAEVYLESEEKWISVDVNHGQIHCVRELFVIKSAGSVRSIQLHKQGDKLKSWFVLFRHSHSSCVFNHLSRATQPVRYILAWNNNMTIKDVTQRYCAQWHSVTRKQRVDDSWWLKTLKPYRGRRTAKDRAEEKDIQRQLHDRPLPTSIGEFKDHPLYVLNRHLLKFQAIYPPDAPTLGFVRGEPIYGRECVYTLHSREIWLKEAKVVKLGETPYKIVKARPKYDRMSGKVVKDLPLEIFGIWQVEDYVPPPAVDGKIPRNAYGNVELFKPCMLPGGTVHLRLPGLNRVARKLQIDCAPAVVGFDYHSGSSHPTFDGFIVCKEFKKVLVAAWEQEQEEADRRYEEKRLKRIYGNWKRLIRGLLIRERLNQRYSFGKNPSTSEPKPSVSKPKNQKLNKNKRLVISSDESG